MDNIERKPRGYYMAWNNVNSILDGIISKLGHFPTQDEMKELDPTLPSAIHKYHGGVRNVREIKGFSLSKRQNRYWNLENTLKECRQVVAEKGDLPSQQGLSKMGLSSLAQSIYQHGGFHKVRHLLGLEFLEREKGYWTEDRVLQEYKELYAKLGRTPSANYLRKNHLCGMADAIARYGGMRAIQKKLDIVLSRKEDGFWSFERVVGEYKKIVEQESRPVTTIELSKRNQPLLSAISRFGGVGKVREALGISEDKKPVGYWNKLNTIKEIIKIIDALGHFPTQTDLNRMGELSLTGSITKNFGFSNLRSILGYDVVKHDRTYWTEERVLSECRKLVEKYGDIPTNKNILRMDAKLAAQIQRKGGYSHFRKLLGLDRTDIKWSKEKLDKYIDEQIKQTGTIPKTRELPSGLMAAIRFKRYDSKIDNYFDYLAFRGLLPNVNENETSALESVVGERDMDEEILAKRDARNILVAYEIEKKARPELLSLILTYPKASAVLDFYLNLDLKYRESLESARLKNRVKQTLLRIVTSS